MNNSEFIKELGEWQERTFPEATNDSIIEHLCREVKELKDNNEPSEAADCLLLLLGHARKNNYDLFSEAKKKFKINKIRKWRKPDSIGVSEHIK